MYSDFTFVHNYIAYGTFEFVYSINEHCGYLSLVHFRGECGKRCELNILFN